MDIDSFERFVGYGAKDVVGEERVGVWWWKVGLQCD
jgi:hypothetical protein